MIQKPFYRSGYDENGKCAIIDVGEEFIDSYTFTYYIRKNRVFNKEYEIIDKITGHRIDLHSEPLTSIAEAKYYILAHEDEIKESRKMTMSRPSFKTIGDRVREREIPLYMYTKDGEIRRVG